jgi:sec-independent protein translocase protein TatA
MKMFQLNLALFDVGGQEMILILVAILILFGAKKLPEMARNLGRSVESFKRAANQVKQEVVNADREIMEDHPKLLSGTEPQHTSYEEAHANYSETDGHTTPAAEEPKPAESKSEITLNVAPATPEGTVSQSEAHDQIPPQKA